jgi:hypothetical protein
VRGRNYSRATTLSEREPQGREERVSSLPPPPSVSPEVRSDSPDTPVGIGEAGSRSENVGLTAALITAARAFLDTLEEALA